MPKARQSGKSSESWGQSRESDRIRLRLVPSRDTGPELVVRRLVHSLGYRYRLHRADLPGKPDLVFPKRRKVIFVHGCFWHRHGCSRGRSTPANNKYLWVAKFSRNVDRDRRAHRLLRLQGWSDLVIWECQLAPGHRYMLIKRISSFLNAE
jgi:DNA mismatch endonuclease (patch repair protein)